MNWDKVQDNFDTIVGKCAELNGTPVTSVIADTVRDTITAMQAGVTEFGGLEDVAHQAIVHFGETKVTQSKPKLEPEEAPKPKRGK